ncbi:DEAD/DEAH box helicase domain [Dillenia turbinata]|uniref:ATP-dependent DNA helicase n=1 Tax=Dillenia turbinata TaxID=194707 RepID=A0AAN8UQG9_9MAGN
MTDGDNVSSDQVIAELVEMGFEFSAILEAIEAVGPSKNNAVEYILNRPCEDGKALSSSPRCSANSRITLGKRPMHSSLSGQARQSRITDHLQHSGIFKERKTNDLSVASASRSKVVRSVKEEEAPSASKYPSEVPMFPVCKTQQPEVGSDWEQRANNLLHKHFGYSSMKDFQKEALNAWIANNDSLVLAATGSGKSLCFQIPALLSGKVVVVISPLISLMHDQCLKLARHGISACFLGSGQPDSTVEKKAMNGIYEIVYVCPETVLRLIKPLQTLAENRGIALFAIDEVHCVSKWGHDFRPDYRRLSVLRKNFCTSRLKFLKLNIPLMALTATATFRVQDDILESLCMSKETKIVFTSFYRPNLRFSVKHSQTSSPSSYEKDFCELIETYANKRTCGKKKHDMVATNAEDAYETSSNSANCSTSDTENRSPSYECISGASYRDRRNHEITSMKRNTLNACNGRQLSVEYLEDDFDSLQYVNDLDVSCGEFFGRSPVNECAIYDPSTVVNPPTKSEERLQLLHCPLEQGPTIIYVPTRKETLSIAKFLQGYGIRADAYNAKLPKSHLRRVHMEFHENALQVVVATIAFGMGIDKLNVRRIIHYGWPQSLEAYYQEAGRAGRDGKLADCILYANLSKVPTLLPSQRSEEQTKHAYQMLADCFRYGMNTSHCRSKILVEYFGEEFYHEKCLLCDICINGSPELQNLRVEVDIFLQVVAAQDGHNLDSYEVVNYRDAVSRSIWRPNIRMVVGKIREQFPKYATSDQLWWRGLARILEGKGYIKEGDDKANVQIKYPSLTKEGWELLRSGMDQSFFTHPEADMLLSMNTEKSYSSFSEWGKGWADPEIRCQRLERRRADRKTRKARNRKATKSFQNLNTVRGRLAAKLSKAN